MDLLIQLLVICAILGIAYWAFTKIPLPQPFNIVVSVIFAIVAIVLLCDFAGIGNLHIIHR